MLKSILIDLFGLMLLIIGIILCYLGEIDHNAAYAAVLMISGIIIVFWNNRAK